MMRWIVFAEKKKDARGLALTVADCETEATGKEDNAMQSGEESSGTVCLPSYSHCQMLCYGVVKFIMPTIRANNK